MTHAEKPSLERAARFLYANGRRLERALFECRYRGGPGSAVAAALRAYRNPDGGLGHALEPDVRAPGSMPLHCELGLRALEDADLRDPELAAGVCEFLATVAEADGRVPIVTREVRDHPHASHWDAPPFVGDSPNPTAALAGLLLAQGVRHPWPARAVEWSWARLERPVEEAHEAVSALTFLERVPERARAEELAVRLLRDPAGLAWYLPEPGDGYGLTPLHLCPTPRSIARAAFPDALLERNLDLLAARQQEDGGWPEIHAAPSPAAALEWRGRWTLDALDVLRAWGRPAG